MIDPHPGVPDDAPERPMLGIVALDAARTPHLVGHRCTDGNWWNPKAGTRPACDTLRHLDVARTQIERLTTRVHDAAHTDRHVAAVATALTSTPLSELPADVRDGWLHMARLAVEALAYSLETNDALTDRAAAAAARHT